MGAAYIGLGKFKEAKAEFKKVLEKMPNDKYQKDMCNILFREAKNQVKICSKEIKAAAFREAIACEETKSIFEQFNLDDYSI